MKVAIQHRNVLLTPPQGLDLMWISRQLGTPEIEEMFCYGGPVPIHELAAARRAGMVVVGIIRRAQDQARLGFALMVPPHEGKGFWELLAAIPDVRNRDAFTMLHAVDIMTHHMFDHVGIQQCGATVRVENRAALAVVRRLGHQSQGVHPDAVGVPHEHFVLDREAWARRLARLQAAEARHPSGLGAVFASVSGTR